MSHIYTRAAVWTVSVTYRAAPPPAAGQRHGTQPLHQCMRTEAAGPLLGAQVLRELRADPHNNLGDLRDALKLSCSNSPGVSGWIVEHYRDERKF